MVTCHKRRLGQGSSCDAATFHPDRGFISFQPFQLLCLSVFVESFFRRGTSRGDHLATGTSPGTATSRFPSSHAVQKVVIGDAIAMARIDGHVLQHSFDSNVPVTMASARLWSHLAGCCQCHDAGSHCRVATGNCCNVLSWLR